MKVYVITGSSPNKTSLQPSISRCEDGTLDEYAPNADEMPHELGTSRRYYCNSRHVTMLFICTDKIHDEVIKYALQKNIKVLDSMHAISN